ncbi:peroxidase, partial [Micrococcus sp. HSID17228]
MPTTDPAVRPDDHHGSGGREGARPAPGGPSRRGPLLAAGAVGGGSLGTAPGSGPRHAAAPTSPGRRSAPRRAASPPLVMRDTATAGRTPPP